MFDGRQAHGYDGSKPEEENAGNGVRAGARMHRASWFTARPLTLALEVCSH